MTTSPRAERRPRVAAAQHAHTSDTGQPQPSSAQPSTTAVLASPRTVVRFVHRPDSHARRPGPPRPSQDGRCQRCYGAVGLTRGRMRVFIDQQELPTWAYG